MPTTANLLLPYPALSAAPNVPADLQALADRLEALYAPGATLGAWAAWTPTLTNFTLGNGTVTAAWKQVGKTVHFRIYAVLGSTSVVGTGPTFTVPVAEKAGVVQAASCGLLDASASADYYGSSRISGGTITPVSSGGKLAVSTPFVWATSDQIILGGSYEAA